MQTEYIVLALLAMMLVFIGVGGGFSRPKAQTGERKPKPPKGAREYIEIDGNVYEYVGKKSKRKTDYFGREVTR